MKQGKYTDNATLAAAVSANEDFYAANFAALPESTAEPKGKILGWHWEPMHETYVLPKKNKRSCLSISFYSKLPDLF